MTTCQLVSKLTYTRQKCTSQKRFRITRTAFGRPWPMVVVGNRGSQAGASRRQPRKTVLGYALASEAPSAPYTNVLKGVPQPLGPSPTETGVNFAVFSRHGTSVTLCLYNEDGSGLGEVVLDASEHRTGDVWHVELEQLPKKGILYGYRVAGKGGWDTGHRWDASRVLLDPYAPLVEGRRWFGQRDDWECFETKLGSVFRGTFDFASPAFDWGPQEAARTSLELKDLVIYEMSVRSFTADESSGLPAELRGTFLGVAEKVEHLVELGVNAVELLPVFEYDELEFQRTPNPRDHMVNIWGYSHMNFFAPMARFAGGGAGPVAAAREFKHMVKTLHAAGIEVILDVVYNHTVEGGDDDPYLLSFRGFDNSVYYQLDTSQYVQLLNFSGCGNTINANHPVVTQLIISSLRHWVEEYHVDGFRFDLASCLCRGSKGEPLPAPPLIRAISKDPVLSRVKLIAEPWDIGMYQVGSFPNWDIWAEWNGQFRDVVRSFIKGDPGMKSLFATRIAGSSDLYHTNSRKPYHSVNFVIAHDGFTLYDLVSYNSKRNGDNGEGNRDGCNDNFSWNCGAEGETQDGGVLALRQRQMRNLMLALLVAQGTPMVLAGDEYAQTRHGNNNWYGHDTSMTRFNWSQLEAQRDGFFRFCSLLIRFRIAHPLLGQAEFLRPDQITWHESNWDNPDSRFLAFSLHHHEDRSKDVYVAFNAHGFAVEAALPAPPPGQQKWCRVVDTNLPAPRDFTEGGNAGVESVYSVAPFSSIVLIPK